MGSEGRHIPNRLKKYRRISGYTQLEVACKLGMKKSNQISQWEKGLAMPSLKNLLRLGLIYKRLAEDLYWDLREMERSELVRLSNK